MRHPHGVRLRMHLPTSESGYEWEIAPTPRSVPAVDAEPPTDVIEQLAAQEIWRLLPSRHPAGGTLEPLTPGWFEHIETRRYRRHGSWLPPLLELDRHQGETIVALGDGLGCDWVKLEKPAAVTVIDPQQERIRLLKRHFDAANANIQTVQGSWEYLPLPDARTDVVMMFFHQRPNCPLKTVVNEVMRVLRPGGKVIAVVPGRFNAARWQDLVLPWRWFNPKADRDNQLTGATLRQLMTAFEQVTVHKRHLRRSELPYLWRWMPLPILERLMGRFLIVKAFKPLQPKQAIRLAA